MASKIGRGGIEVLNGKQNSKPQYFRFGDAVPMAGVYRVFHANHRVSHDVLLLSDDHFPRCRECGDSVHFELVQAVPDARAVNDWRLRLFEIPHPEEKVS